MEASLVAVELATKGIVGLLQGQGHKTRTFVARPLGERSAPKNSMFVAITKADDEQQTVTGVVLQPEVVDAQGDVISKEVIREAAHKFLNGFNQQTKLGLQHNSFKQGRFALAESYIAPMDFALNDKTVLEGSWIMVVKVFDAAIWKLVKSGNITGFSIGGKAQVQSLGKPSL